MSITPYLEANALLAIQEDDLREAHKVLDQMLPGELYTLAKAAESLAWRARNTADNKVLAEERSARNPRSA